MAAPPQNNNATQANAASYFSVGTGPVTPNGDSGKYDTSKTRNPGIWTDCQIINRYESDRRIYMMSLCFPRPGGERILSTAGAGVSQHSTATISNTSSSKPSVAFVQLGSPTLLWICDWTVCRTSAKPIAPDPDPGDSNWVLLDEWIEPVKIVVLDDAQTPVYRLSGTYFYGHTNPSANPIDNMNFPRPPWLQNAFSRNITKDMFDSGLSNDSGIAGGGGHPAQPITQ